MKNPGSIVIRFGLAAATFLLFTGCGPADHAGHDHAGHDHSHAAPTGAPVPAVTPQATEASALVVIENPTAEQLAAAKPYPLDTCLVAGEKLGEMGEPLVVVVGNQQVKLCCDHCLPELKKNPAEFLAKLKP
jgi:hypothetical protein